MYKNYLKISLLLFTVLTACQGTDILDDAIVEPKFELSATTSILRIGEEATITAKYFDEYGVEKIVPFTWNSIQPLIASVSPNGRIKGLKEGNPQIFPQYQNIVGKAVEVTVVANDKAIAQVTLSASKTSLALNESINLSIVTKNITGQPVTGIKTEWFSENEAILKVDASGKVTALANGTAAIHAKVDGVKSNSIDFFVGSNNLSGTFISAGYKAAGSTTLKVINDELILSLSSDFESEYHLATYVYLSNSIVGSIIRSSGIELAEIKTNGAKTFNVSQIKPGIKLTDYKYVTILCKPASVTFGYAELK